MTEAPTAASAAARASVNGTIFEAEEVLKRFGGIHAVDGASLGVRESSITALIGPNGAGKTTFFNVITGFYGPDGGTAVFQGSPILGRSPHAIARLGMVRTFQITKALAAMPVIDNMMLAAPEQPGELLRNVFFKPGQVRARERQVREEAVELLEVFNLADLARVGPLDPGEDRQQRRLARPVGADDSQDLTSARVQADIVQSSNATEIMADAVNG